MRRRFINKSKIIFDYSNYLTIEALEDGLTVSQSIFCEYCIDGSGKWIPLFSDTFTSSVNKGQTLSFRANRANLNESTGTFTITKLCNLKGNCMSMLFGDDASANISLSKKERVFEKLFYNASTVVSVSRDFLPATTLAYGCYRYMFYGCTSLINAPELPATTLAYGCYGSMFLGCTSLTEAPKLHVTYLATSCYEEMFLGCTSLTIAPELPATTLAENCYSLMFLGCKGLTVAPVLPVTTLAMRCYSGMFEDCTGLTIAPELPATTLALGCYSLMFKGCTNLISAPELPATTLAENCYSLMFYRCVGLTLAPELPATTLAISCYEWMFSFCYKLNHIKMLATDISATDCLLDWVESVSSTGTFVKNKDATWDTTPGALGNNGIPAGWTVVNDGETEITFYVNDIPYTALEGMTWYEFMMSDRNVYVEHPMGGHLFPMFATNSSGDINIEDVKIYYQYNLEYPGEYVYIYTEDYTRPSPVDKIIADKKYYAD